MTETMLNVASSSLDAIASWRNSIPRGSRVQRMDASDQALADEMCEFIDPARRQTILELGAGTGSITRVACQRMHRDSRLIAIEVDRRLAAVLAARCPKAQLVISDVRNLGDHLRALRVDHVDVVLSNVSVPRLPRESNEAIFECCSRLAPDAWFSQLTTLPWVHWHVYQQLFREVKFRLVLSSAPPSGVYHCFGLRGDYADCLPNSESPTKPR
jgi:phospholipid N-methyltransferase